MKPCYETLTPPSYKRLITCILCVMSNKQFTMSALDAMIELGEWSTPIVLLVHVCTL